VPPETGAGAAAAPQPTRCAWVGTDPLYVSYHDEEWGVPVHDDRLLFEFLVLEGAQAGLSWLTILRKREGYRRAFAGFDPAVVAGFGDADVERLLADQGIVRNRLKVGSAIDNARAFLRVQEEFGSFDAYVWRFTGGETLQNEWRTMSEIPAKTAEAERMSADLKKRGFRFVGPTICYAHMQATGMVNDHTVDCFRYPELRPGWR
jgi:DNA-3-methyladenine glycosylase I